MDGPKSNNEHVEVIRADAPVTNSLTLAKASREANDGFVRNYLQQRANAVRQGLAALPLTNLTGGFGDPLIRSTFLRFLLDGARDIDAECGYPYWLTPDHYNGMYNREGPAKRVVHCEPEESWVEDPDLYEDEDPQTDTKFEKAWKNVLKRWNVWHHLLRIDILSGIGQYGVLLLGIDDGKELWEPVEGIDEDGTVTGKPKYKLLYIRPFDETVTFIKTREADASNPRYGQPVVYRIEFRDFPNWGIQAGEIIARDVHWTRIIHVADNRKMSEVFGIPRMQQVYNRLYDIRKIMAASGEGYWKGAFPGVSFEIMPEIAQQGIDFTDEDKKSLRAEMENYQRGLQRYIALNGMHASPLPIQVVDPTGMAEAHLKNIAISLDIPYRVLFGSEEAKLAGTQDGRKWARRIRRRQLRYVEPLIIRPFVDRLIAFGVLPPCKEFFIDWPDLNSPADIDKAAIAAQYSAAMAQYVQSGATQIMAPEMYLTKIMGFSPDEAKEAMDGAMMFSQSQMLDDGTEELEAHEGNLGVGGVQQDTGDALLQDSLSGANTLPKRGKNKRRVDSQVSQQPALPSLNVESKKNEDEGHWVTIGAGKEEGSEEAHGGVHVFIKDGKIEKGPKKMVGKSPKDLGKADKKQSTFRPIERGSNEPVPDGGDKGQAKTNKMVKGLHAAFPALKAFSDVPVKYAAKSPYGDDPEAQTRTKDILVHDKFFTHDKFQQQRIMAHEYGHWLLHQTIGLHGLSQKVDIWDALPFGQESGEEAFAECFAEYAMNPKELHQRYPKWEAAVKDVVAGWKKAIVSP